MSRVSDLMRSRLPRFGRRTRWTVAILAVAVALAVLLSFLIDEPLRRSVEGQMNARLTGYSVSIGKLRFHPIGLSLTLFDLVFTQQANPEPPAAVSRASTRACSGGRSSHGSWWPTSRSIARSSM